MRKILKKIIKKLLPCPKSKHWAYIKPQISGASGLEIAGTTPYFRSDGLCPVYKYCAKLDNCNFSPQPFSGDHYQNGDTYLFRPKNNIGRQFIAEATNLHIVSDGQYDFILSSHVLEHIANPLKSLTEWRRITKKNGFLLLIVPYKEHIFDHRRDNTAWEHLLADYQNNTEESDLTHLAEIIDKHDLEMDKLAGTREEFAARSKNNLQWRCLHHHVFCEELVKQCLNFCDWQLEKCELLDKISLLFFARNQ